MNRSQALDSAPQYFHNYIKQVDEGDILSILEGQVTDIKAFFAAVTPEQWGHAYAEGKWTLQEVLGHLIDTERVFGYRALRFARKDATDLPGYDENHFVAQGNFKERDPQGMIDEFVLLRQTNLLMLRNLPEGGMDLLGTANALLMSVGAIAWVLAGHPNHHIGVIKERYL